jgi:hypothetical protein
MGEFNSNSYNLAKTTIVHGVQIELKRFPTKVFLGQYGVNKGNNIYDESAIYKSKYFKTVSNTGSNKFATFCPSKYDNICSLYM